MPEPLPLFPLNVVLVPGLVLPLHIFEPRYRQLVTSLLARPDESTREFGIVAVREGRSFENDGVSAVYPVGTATVLREAEQLPDGRFNIVTTGSRRFRIASVDCSEPLAMAMVDFLDEDSGPPDAPLVRQVARRFTTYRRILGGRLSADAPDEADAADLPVDPTVLSYLVTAAMVLPTAERQELLGAPTTHDRLLLASAILARENGIIAALAAVPAVEPLADADSLN